MSGIPSKRYLNEKNKNNESILHLKDSEEELKGTSIGTKKLSRQDIDEMDDKLAKAHIESLNTDFVIQNPYVHAFRSDSIKPSS